ncbi:MAG: hypothetical protein JSW18_04840 [Candidatus Omnitrophota bacterium]|nr:MAG: hypothetical protein JSW18_04840 [Candidatus Omnitrophota bacterium]
MRQIYLFVSILAILTFFLTGCAEIEPPGPDVLISPWSSMPNIRLGDTKEDVISRWGEPDEKNEIGVDELGVAKEEWVYYGRYPMVPVDYQYVSKTKYLYFEGNILIRQETKSAPSPEKK